VTGAGRIFCRLTTGPTRRHHLSANPHVQETGNVNTVPLIVVMVEVYVSAIVSSQCYENRFGVPRTSL